MKAVYTDGAIFIAITVLTGLTGILGGEEAAKYFDPKFLFFARNTCALAGMGLSALKAFRSLVYGTYLNGSAKLLTKDDFHALMSDWQIKITAKSEVAKHDQRGEGQA